MGVANRRQYTAQTKLDAVGQVMKAGLPLRQVARSFEMPQQTLENWVRKAKQGQVIKVPKAADASSALGYATPAAFEEAWLAKQALIVDQCERRELLPL